MLRLDTSASRARSTPRSTSTPPNDLRIPRARSRKRSVTLLPGLAGQVRVIPADVLAVHRVERDVEQLRQLLALDRLDHRRYGRPAILLREDRSRGQPVRVGLDAAPAGLVRHA